MKIQLNNSIHLDILYFKEDLQSIEFATSRGKRKVEKAVTSETSQKSGPKKKAKKVIEDVIDEVKPNVSHCVMGN